MSHDPVNPYSSPAPEQRNPFAETPDDAGYGPPRPMTSGMVGQVRAIAILMIVQGVLEAIMGLFLAAMAVVMPFIMNEQMKAAPPGPNAPPPDFMWIFMLCIYGGMALVNIAAAGLHICAGIQNYRFRNWGLGIAALIGGCVTILSCYCGVTGVALAIFGLIVYFNDSTRRAFEQVKAGQPVERALAGY